MKTFNITINESPISGARSDNYQEQIELLTKQVQLLTEQVDDYRFEYDRLRKQIREGK